MKEFFKSNKYKFLFSAIYAIFPLVIDKLDFVDKIPNLFYTIVYMPPLWSFFTVWSWVANILHPCVASEEGWLDCFFYGMPTGIYGDITAVIVLFVYAFLILKGIELLVKVLKKKNV